MTTEKLFDNIIADCRQIFIDKMQDYGPSWRILRIQSINDQLYIKIKRIREIETTGVNMVGEAIDGELRAIINYSVMGLIQLEQGYADDVDMSREQALELYDKYVAQARALMIRKNHDYGQAWREMEKESITDLIFAKVLRNKQIAQNKGMTLISEGLDGNYFDMINYAVFNLIKIAA